MLVPDVIHDILEGVLQYECKHLLVQLISEKLITLEDLNRCWVHGQEELTFTNMPSCTNRDQQKSLAEWLASMHE